MLTIFQFTTPEGQRGAVFETGTPNLVESSKIVVEMANMYRWATGMEVNTIAIRNASEADGLPPLSREFFTNG